MALRVVVILLAALGLLARDGPAGAASDLTRLPIRPRVLGPPAAQPEHAANCYESFANTLVPTGFYYPAGAGVEVRDDLHLGTVYVSGLCAFDIGYYKSGAGTTNATVTFYQNNSVDDPPGPMLATFALPGLPSGENGMHVEVPGSALSQDVWMGVSFSTADAGLQTADPAWPGTSDDYFHMNPPGGYYTFGGNPKADFFLGVYATGGLVSVDPASGLPAISGFTSNPAPNPTTAGVSFRFALREEGLVRVQVLDPAGREVALIKNEMMHAGVHALAWDGRTSHGARAAPGVYLLRLTLPQFAATRKLVVVK